MVYVIPQWGKVIDTPMRFFSIIPDKILHEFLIKDLRFIQVVNVQVNTLLLNGPVESLQVGVRFWMLGIIEEMGQAVLLAIAVEVVGKFTAVVRLDSLSDKRGYSNELPKEIITTGRRSGLIGIGEGKSGADINRGEDIAFEAGGEDRDRVHLDEVAGELRKKALPSHFLLLRFRFPYQ